MFWAPELERERKARLGEKTRAEKAESVLKSQLEKGVRYMQKLVHLEAAYEELEIGAQKQARLEAELRASLEAQLKEKLNQDGGGGGGGGGGGPDLGPKVAAQTYEIQRLQKELTDASDQVTMLRRTLETTEAVAAKVLLYPPVGAFSAHRRRRCGAPSVHPSSVWREEAVEAWPDRIGL